MTAIPSGSGAGDALADRRRQGPLDRLVGELGQVAA